MGWVALGLASLNDASVLYNMDMMVVANFWRICEDYKAPSTVPVPHYFKFTDV